MHSSSPIEPDNSVHPARPSHAARHVPPARLGIVHLLAWMVGSALMLAMFRRFDLSIDGQISPLRAVVYLFYGLIYGAALAGLLIPFSRYAWGGAPYPIQPGHWLLVANGVVALVFCGVLALDSLPGSEAFSLALQAGASALPAVAYLWGTFATRDAARWTVLLGALATLHAVQAVSLGLLAVSLDIGSGDLERMLVPLLQVLQSHGTLGAGLLVLLAAAWDLSGRVSRDWLHWVGVLVELATIVWIVFGVFGGVSVFW